MKHAILFMFSPLSDDKLDMRKVRNLLSIIAIILYSCISFAGAPNYTTFQTKIMAPSGLPLENPAVNFRFTILDSFGTCVLYIEDYVAVNMTGSSGVVSFSLGTGTKSYPGTATLMSEVFNNSVTVPHPCQAGGTYAPGASDRRQIVMQFNDGSGWQTLPQMAINSVFYANYASTSEKLGNYVSSDYLRPATLPTCIAGQALHYNGTSFTCVAASGGGGVTSVNVNSPLTVVNTTSTPVISLPKATGAVSGYLSSADWAAFNAKASATLSSGSLYVGNGSNAATGVTLSGDATLNSSGDLSLKNSGVAAGTFGSASSVPAITVDAKGRVTNATSTPYQNATGAVKGVVQVGSNISIAAGVISLTSADVTNALTYVPMSNAVPVFVQNGNTFGATANLGTSDNNNLNLMTSGTPKITVQSNGNVGIGTTTPNYKVDVNGDVNVSGNFKVNGVNISTGSGTVTNVSGSGPISVVNTTTTPVISIATASASIKGVLSSNDWTSFNAKLNNISSDVTTALGYTPVNRNLASANIFVGNAGGIATGVVLSGDASLNTSGDLSLATTGVGAGTYSKVTVDTKGRVTSATTLSSSDLTTIGAFNNGGNSFASNATLGTNDNFDLSFKTNNTTNMTILANGNVGIGTTTPTSLLDVRGGITAKSINLVAGNAGMTNATGGSILVNPAASTFLGENGGSVTVTSGDAFDAGRPGNIILMTGNDLGHGGRGKVGINTSNPVAALTVLGDYEGPGNTSPVIAAQRNWSPTVGLHTTMSFSSPRTTGGMTNFGELGIETRDVGNATYRGDLIFKTSNQATPLEKMRIDYQGNVGIGTTTPNYKLDVNGDVNVSGNFKVNGVNIVAGSGTVTNVSGSGPINVVNTTSTPTISIAMANGTTAGALSSSDWSIFYNKMNNVSSDITTALGFTPLNKVLSPNFIFVGSAGSIATGVAMSGDASIIASGNITLTNSATTRGNLGLGTTATFNVPVAGDASSTEVVRGTDSRLIDSRAPMGIASGDLTGSYPAPTLAATGVGTGTYSKLTVDTKGRVTAATQINSGDVTTALGYTPSNITSQWISNSNDISYSIGNVGIGTNSPTSVLDISGAFSQRGMIAPAVSPGGQGRIYFDSTLNTFKVSQNGAAYVSLVGGSGSGITADAPKFNLFAGPNAGTAISTGVNDSFYGVDAGKSDQDGNFNTGIGAQAMKANVDGSVNTAIGDQALSLSVSGWENTAVGAGALKMTNGGEYNTATGANTMESNTTGNDNSAIGDVALRSNTTGSNNVVIGSGAGYANVTGGNNTYIGTSAGGNSTGSGNLFLGYSAGSNETGSNKLYIANSNTATPLIYGDFSSGNVGIGTTTPAYKLDVIGDVNVTGNFKINGTNVAAGGGTVTNVSGSGPISVVNTSTTPVISIATASASVSGALSSSDWSIFNNKMNNVSSDITTALGFTPLNKVLSPNFIFVGSAGSIATGVAMSGDASILSSGQLTLTNGATTRGNLGLGTAATFNVPVAGDASSTEVVRGTDSRLIDSRAPIGVASGDLTGSYPAPTLTTTGVGNGTYTKVTVDTKGRVTSATQFTSADITTAMGYTPGAGSQWTTNSSDISYSTGKVGIGTTTPNEQLEITGNFRIPSSSATVGVIKQGNANLLHTVGTQSTYLGNNAGNLTNTASYNVGVGFSSMNQVTSGSINAAVGDAALSALTTGNYNSAIGAGALKNLVSGSDNIAVGANSMQNTISGLENTFVGSNAGERVLNNHNSGLGYQALWQLTTGTDNVAIGVNAGGQVITGSRNIAIGNSSGVTSSNLVNTIAIGTNAVVGASNSMVLGGVGADAVNVGIGTTAPNWPLHIATTSAGTPTMVAMDNVDTTNGNGANLSFRGTTTGISGGSLREFAAIQASYSEHSDATASASLKFWTRSNGPLAERMRIDTAGRVGIGTTTPSSALALNGGMTFLPTTATSTTPVAAEGKIYYDVTANKFKVSENNGGYVNLVGTSSQWTTVGSDIQFSTGKVGIGTTSPQSLLHVEDFSGSTFGARINHQSSGGSFGAALNVTEYGASSSAYGIMAEKTTSGGAAIYGWASQQGPSNAIGVLGESSGSAGIGVRGVASLANNTGAAVQAENSSATGFSVYAPGVSPNYFAGNVGIGTTSTSEKLQVNGNIALTSANSKITGSTGISLEATGDTYGTVRLNLQNRSGVNGAMFEQAGSVDLVDFVFKGLSNQRNIRFENRGTAIFAAAPEFQFGAAADPTLVVADTVSAFRKGNVGIGTTSPVYKLDVIGDVNVTGNFKINGTNIGGGVSGSGTTNYIPKFSGATTVADSPLSFSGADTLIFGGTTNTPASIQRTGSAGALILRGGSSDVTGAMLYLSGNSDANGGMSGVQGSLVAKLGTNATSQFIITDDSYQDILHFNATGGLTLIDPSSGLSYLETKAPSQGTGQLYVRGNVGIGTTTPSTSLALNGVMSFLRTPAASATPVTAEGKIYYDDTTNKFKVSENNGAFVDLVGPSAPYDNVASLTFNMNNGTTQYTSASCAAVTLQNLKNGGDYTVIIQGTTSGTCTFTHTGETFLFNPVNGSTISGTETIYTLKKVGSKIYVNWTSGYQ